MTEVCASLMLHGSLAVTLLIAFALPDARGGVLRGNAKAHATTRHWLYVFRSQTS